MTPIAVIAGMLVVAGALGIVLGVRRSWSPAPRSTAARTPLAQRWARATRRPSGAAGRRRDVLLIGSIAAGLVLGVATGWTLLVVVVPLLVIGLPVLLRLPTQRDVALMEALDRWLRSLAATLATGRSITDAIRGSLRTAPPGIRDEIAALIARLNNRWDTTDALHRFADDLDSADADAVVAALILAADRGSVGASVTLLALADNLQDQLRARRLIETERAKPYVVVRQVTVITLLTLIAVAALNPTYFSAYHTPLGQVILVALLAMYAASLVLMRRKARQQPRTRILVARHGSGGDV